MRVLGSLVYASEQYYVFLNDTKNKEIWYLVSPYHKADIRNHLLGGELNHPVISSTFQLEKEGIPEDYIIEAVSRTKVSGKVQIYGKYLILEKLLSTLGMARGYSFAKDNVYENSNVLSQGKLVSSFFARDINLKFQYTMENKLITMLSLSNKDIELDISLNNKVSVAKDLEFKEASKNIRKRVLLSSVKAVDYATLEELLDLDWYRDRDSGVVKKDYKVIKTKEEFEVIVIQGIMEEIRACKRRGERLLLSVDTETTGLNICNLSPENEAKDRCVAIPIAWKDNQAVTVFVDMEYFDNVSSEYVFQRLKQIMEKESGIELDISKQAKQHCKQTTGMDLFGDNVINFPTRNPMEVDDDYFYIPIFRRDIQLIGHNVMFDGKVFYDNDVKPRWDDDTLQMAFNLNSRIIKGNNKLKNLTRKFFGHETPELDDILGKGNEDKYRYISDERVAMIYGCADADYTRLVYKKLRALTPDYLYKAYQKQDMPMLNILYVSEYYGLKMDEERVKKQGALVKQDIESLEKFMFRYVGINAEYKNQMIPLKIKRDAGIINDIEYHTALREIKVNPNAEYLFELTGAGFRKVLYDILEYPVVAKTDGKKPLPKVDKIAMQRLMTKTLQKPSNFLREDLISSDGKTALVEAKKFNKYRYPLAYVISVYAALNKEYTSYYKPIVEDNLEGKLFKGYSLTRIETRRIMNPSQTMKGSLKVLTLAYDDDYYMMDFDMSQVEYRIMISLAGFISMIERMKDPEKDYHTETAALVNRLPAHKVSKKLRKQTKSISFGVPYGLGEMSLAIKLFGEATEDTLYATRKLLYDFSENNKPVIDLIEGFRDDALKEVNISSDLRDYLDAYEKNEDGNYKLDPEGNKVPLPVGMITNKLGFYRWFDLSNMDKKKRGSIRRAAGNYPVQSFAAELFRTILIRFYERCEQEGIQDKIIWHMLIHDELLLSVHKSVFVVKMIKIIKEACMITLKGHTKYFVGINIGDNWEECKDDKSELPVLFVNRMIERYENGEFKEEWLDSPKTWVKKYKDEYIKERIHECLVELQPDIDNAPIDLPYIMEHFSNYTVRAYVSDFFNCNYEVENPKDEANQDAVYASKFESWVLAFYGEGKALKALDGSLKRVYAGQSEIEEVALELELYNQEELAEGYWSLEDQDLDEYYTKTVYIDDMQEDELGYSFDLSVEGAKTVADLIVSKPPTYKHIKIVNGQLYIQVDREVKLNKIKEYLQKFVNNNTNSYSVLFKTSLRPIRWLKISADIDLHELDDFISEVI